ncbi:MULTISPECIES: 3-hydroxyacyl-CoA dehydrogenase family protein [unclassified Phaeobacter]|uniref:3-hydroxyacyl-CoA dehydrogenase family protein n=1 Tax=unclassified Phaeobacter TaxID=2621772 RepID=UPI003A83F932
MSHIKRIAVIGAGTMGGGIAISAICSGVDVILVDTSQLSLNNALARVRKYLTRQVEKQKMTEKAASAALGRLATSTALQEAAGSDLVIEAVFEDLDVKQSVFAEIEQAVAPTTFLATNTSALKVADIGSEMAHPERLCGMHYFSPAEVNPVVEVIRAEYTVPDTVAAVLPFLTQCKKEAIKCKDHHGFALNRFFCPYTNEAARCLDDGLGSPAQIDAVAKEVFGVPVGPFFVMNIVKPRINLAAVRSLASLGPFYAPAVSLQRCGDGDQYWDLSDCGTPLSETACRQISDRLKGAVFLAVQEELNEEIAEPEAIDLGARKAFAFAKGPVEMMRTLDEHALKRLFDLVRRSDGVAH